MTGASKPRVAALDPDPITRELLALYLAPLDVELHWDGSVRAALAALASVRPRVVFCAEAALRDAEADERSRLRSGLAQIAVVRVLEPGESSQLSGDWPMVTSQLTKPLPLAGVLDVCDRWCRPSGQPGTAEATEPHPLAGLEALMAETGMDETMVGELLESFLERMHAYFGEIRQALESQDPKQLERTAHSLKGMCANLRLDGLVALSDALRGDGQSGDFKSAVQSSERLRAEFDRVAGAVQARGPSDH